MKLSFSTLACPAWDWDTVINQAKATGYDGIEVRGIGNELDIDKLPMFRQDNVRETVARLKDEGLSIPCLDTSGVFLNDFQHAVESGRAAILTAQRLGTPYIRMFPDRIPQGMGRDAAAARVAEGMQALGSFAEGHGVTVLLESHGDFLNSGLLLDVFGQVRSPAAALLWDSGNTFEAGEPVEDTCRNLRPLIRHVHVKDNITRGGKLTPCLPGSGHVPIGRVVRALREAGYDGWLSFEWEKRWHPEIEGPETALPAYVAHMRELLAAE